MKKWVAALGRENVLVVDMKANQTSTIVSVLNLLGLPVSEYKFLSHDVKAYRHGVNGLVSRDRSSAEMLYPSAMKALQSYVYVGSAHAASHNSPPTALPVFFRR